MLFNTRSKENSKNCGMIRISIDSSSDDFEILKNAIVGKITIGFNRNCKIYTSKSKTFCSYITFYGSEIEKTIIDNYLNEILESMEETERLRLA